MANVQVPVGMSYCTLVAIGAFGDSPVQMTCPNCHQTMVTKVDFSSGVLTYLFCGGLFFCGLKDAKHTCPSCKTILGVYKRL
eukprot:XP_013985571.1 PREDICTED: lipopolysaccharide-induced tumor necrosis factor-alpha factor homolog isoform X3 [Salmo salar]